MRTERVVLIVAVERVAPQSLKGNQVIKHGIPIITVRLHVMQRMVLLSQLCPSVCLSVRCMYCKARRHGFESGGTNSASEES